MTPCIHCGDENICYFCKYGPFRIESYQHYIRGISGNGCSEKCSVCGTEDIRIDSSATEWGVELYAIESTITSKFICKNCPIPRKCRTCRQIFKSGNELFRHLRTENHEKDKVR